MNIKFNDLSSQWSEISEKALPSILNVLEIGNFILGKQVSEFEDNFKKWNGNKYAIGVANGTDALMISVESLSLSENTMFYIPANTYIATLLGVVLSSKKNYKYKLIDCDEYYQIDTNLLENEIEKDFGRYDDYVVIPVHLYGVSCNMLHIMSLRKKYNFKIIEDCSQSHGTLTNENKKVGTYGDVSAFSLYPGKNLGAAGDAGIIVTDNEDIYNTCLKLRNLGSIEKYKHEIIGWNSRLDTIQSVILNEKIKLIDGWNSKRNYVAEKFLGGIKNQLIELPETPKYCNYNTYHIFPILCDIREKLIDYLTELGIPSIIHYPIPIELSGAFLDTNLNNQNTIKFSKTLLSLPIHPFMSEEEINYIINSLNNFEI
jgi:dTDP-4-amino-4,6-dideoxygalactose transaminase